MRPPAVHRPMRDARARTSTLDKSSATSGAAGVPTSVPPPPVMRVPEDLVLAPGQFSTIDRKGKNLDGDVFRCFGCTKSECQVRPRPPALGMPFAAAELMSTLPTSQGPSGCAINQWRYQPDGYLREVLTARVYDVAVSCRRKKANC
jgi:threonine dehydratase